MTFLRSFVDRYALERGIAPATVEQLEVTARLLDKFCGHSVAVDHLSDDLANRFLMWLGSGSRKPNTIASKRRALLTLWRAAYDAGLAKSLPHRVRTVRLPESIPEAWTPAEMQALLAACDSLRGKFRKTGIDRRWYFRSFVLADWDTALRLSDLLSLERSWIWQGGYISVVQKKTGLSHRVRFRPETMAAIDAHYTPDRRLIWPLWSCRRQWYRAFKRLVVLAGLGKGTSKWIRRSSATAVEIEQPGAAMRHLGHRTPGLAYRHYVDARQLGRQCTMPPQIAEK